MRIWPTLFISTSGWRYTIHITIYIYMNHICIHVYVCIYIYIRKPADRPGKVVVVNAVSIGGLGVDLAVRAINLEMVIRVWSVFSRACTTRQLGDGGGSIPPRSAEHGRKKVRWGWTKTVGTWGHWRKETQSRLLGMLKKQNIGLEESMENIRAPEETVGTWGHCRKETQSRLFETRNDLGILRQWRISSSRGGTSGGAYWKENRRKLEETVGTCWKNYDSCCPRTANNGALHLLYTMFTFHMVYHWCHGLSQV